MVFDLMAMVWLDGQVAAVFNSPFVIPVAGCAMVACIVVSSMWAGIRSQEIKSQERLAKIAQGILPEPAWEEEALRQATAKNAQPQAGPACPNDGSRARRAGIILVAIGLGLIFFFFVLALAVHTSEVLAGSAAGIIPLAIGIGFLADARMRRRDYDRWMDTVYPRMGMNYVPGPFAAVPGPYAAEMPPPPPPPPAAAPNAAGLTPAQASDWRPLH